MVETVIIPTFQRSDLLFLCLEAIRDIEPKIPIHIWPDRGTDEREIANKFNATHHWTLQHSYHGNSFNVLEALKWAHAQQSERVYIIEDDSLVDRTFFDWCRNALISKPDSFAACGWQYSPNAVKGDGPDIQIPWYLSVATCIPQRSLSQIVTHANIDYYRDMQGYLDYTFPTSSQRGSLHYEQDGLVLRVAEAQRKRCVWPRRPRSLHCGWYGYHQVDGKRLEGSLDERVSILRLAVHNPSILTNLMAGGALPTIGKCKECGRVLAVERASDPVYCGACFCRHWPERTIMGLGQYYVNDNADTTQSLP